MNYLTLIGPDCANIIFDYKNDLEEETKKKVFKIKELSANKHINRIRNAKRRVISQNNNISQILF